VGDPVGFYGQFMTFTQPKTRLVTPALTLRFISIVGSSVGFYLPLSVLPMLAGSAQDAGLVTVVLLLTTVAGEMVTPRLVARIGYRWALATGLTLLGLPTLVLAFTHEPWVIMAVSVLRGAGFAVSVVAGGAITAMLIPASRRGEGLALVGLVGGVPGTLALPAGVWIADSWGYAPVFVLTTVFTLLGLLSVPGLPSRAVEKKESHGVMAGLRSASLTRPAIIFAASAAAAGVLITFLPLATNPQLAAGALLGQPAAATATRWIAGRIGDKRGQACLLVPGLLLVAVGMVLTGSVPIVGAVVFGAGFGILQNATLTLMYARVPAGGEGTVSAIWNAAYDLGMAAGALGAAFMVTSVGYSMTFILTAALALPALALVRRDRRS
jgi:predicted MFS family arabinose efflux permease